LARIGTEYSFFSLTRVNIETEIKDFISCEAGAKGAVRESPYERWIRTGHSVSTPTEEQRRVSSNPAMASIQAYGIDQGDEYKKKSFNQQQLWVGTIACFMLNFFRDSDFSEMLFIYSNSTTETPHTKFSRRCGMLGGIKM
jgi:hypothetical protein